jgi:ATP-dependent Clp protease adapter protein ClpS
MEKLMWWGYLHSNGEIQVKRWFGDHKDYTDDCEGNDFVVEVVRPFAAQSREEALEILKQKMLGG